VPACRQSDSEQYAAAGIGAFDLAIAVLWESEELKRLERFAISIAIGPQHTAGRTAGDVMIKMASGVRPCSIDRCLQRTRPHGTVGCSGRRFEPPSDSVVLLKFEILEDPYHYIVFHFSVWWGARFLLSEIKIYRMSWIKRINKIYRKYRTKFKKI
jgi:hypothetical protein